MLNKKTLFFIIFVFVSYMYAYNAKTLGSANSNGMYLRGVDAINYNPALLGLSDEPNFTINILPAFNMTFSTYTDVSLGMYNDYFSKGVIWTPSVRKNIIDEIDGGELNFGLDFRNQLIAVTYQNFSFQMNLYSNADICVDKDLLEIFNGFEEGRKYSGNDSDAEGMAYTSFEFGYAHDIFQYFKESNFFSTNKFLQDLEISEISAGANVKFILTPAIETDTIFMKLNKVEAEFVNEPITTGGASQKRLNADIEMLIGGDGAGYALDLGVAMKFKNNMQLGLSVENLLGRIMYSNNTVHRWILKLDSVNIDKLQSFDDFDPNENEVEWEEHKSYKDFSEPLPTIINLGYSWQIYHAKNNFLTSANISTITSRLTNKGMLASIATGVDWYHDSVDWLRLRTGIKYGTPNHVDFGFGLGLAFTHYTFDLGLVSRGGLGQEINGVSIGLGMKLIW